MKSEIREAFEAQRQRLEGREDHEYLGELSPTEAMVLRFRLGLGEIKKSLREIGEGLGITKQRVGQIEKEALRKILRWRRLRGELSTGSAAKEEAPRAIAQGALE